MGCGPARGSRISCPPAGSPSTGSRRWRPSTCRPDRPRRGHWPTTAGIQGRTGHAWQTPQNGRRTPIAALAPSTGKSIKLDSMDPITPPPRSRTIYLLPNLFTTAGLFAGFYAIIAAANGDFVNASIAVFVAAVMDGLDGRVARLTGTSSEFGVQYDSLADLVSFGMAPALVMYHWSLSWLKFDDPLLGRVGWAVAFLYAACAALRLARFNTQVAVVDKRWFVGLASPAAAGLMMSFVWAFADGNLGWDGNQLRYVALAVTIIAALLMVSRIRFWSFKGGAAKGTRSDRVPFLVLALVPVAIAIAVIDLPRVLFAVGILYALSGPVMWAVQRLRKRPEAA
ncbi:phosphatidylserine synthase [Stenotrophomonas maltophilia SKK35]|nr:phosphatidylserine synthase [Stenotrophomonas maltophilia SKK35]